MEARKVYSGADTIDVIVTGGTATQGEMDIYIVTQKLI